MQMRHDLVPGVSIVDTTWMTWPGLSPDVGRKLAATHRIGRNAYAPETVALDLGTYLPASPRTA